MITTRTTSVVLAALLSLVVLAGCGGSSGGSDDAKPKDSAKSGYTSAADVGKDLPCADVLPDVKQQGATDSILCGYAGDQVIVSWFKTKKLAKAFPDLPVLASHPTVHVYGPNWAVGCFSRSVCEAAQKVLGGKLV